MKKIPRATWQRAKDHPGELACIPPHCTYPKDPRMERCNQRQLRPISDRQLEIWPTTIGKNLRIPADKTFANQIENANFTPRGRAYTLYILESLVPSFCSDQEIAPVAFERCTTRKVSVADEKCRQFEVFLVFSPLLGIRSA